ncbi:MAG: SRPBCC domain-containing protein [Pseudomonadota bacterium]
MSGRLFESFETATGEKVEETGRLTCFDPPSRLVLEWRAVNFAAHEKTEVEVLFVASPSGTLMTLCHRGKRCVSPLR